MKKKGTTESYSAFIGIIIAVLMLTAIGCAVYNIYKPKGYEYFDKLVNFLQKLEKDNTYQEGEFPLFIEKDSILLGFGKGKEYIGKKGLGSIFDWECYGIKFAWGIYTPFGVTGSIDRPSKCPAEKSCLCLCKISKMPYRVKQDACQGSDVKCAAFDELDFIGGEGCPQGVFIPGMRHELIRNDYERGLRVLQYSKQGNIISLDDVKALSDKDLKKRIEEDKKNVTKEEKEEAKIVISASCGEENEIIINQLVPIMWDWDYPTSVLSPKTEEGTCLIPSALSEKIDYEYKSAESFLQIEYDKSIRDDNTAIIAYQTGTQKSLSYDFANDFVTEFQNMDFKTTLVPSKDPVIEKVDKPAVEIKVSKDNKKATSPILNAIKNFLQKISELKKEKEKADVVISSSCGEENEQVKEGIKTQLRDNWGLIPAEVEQKSKEGTCILPEVIAGKVEEDYKSAEYFLQIEMDNSIVSENQVMVNSVEGNYWSLKLADDIAEELRDSGFEIIKGSAKDPVMDFFITSLKAAVEVKMQKEDTKVTEPIAKAVAKNKQKSKTTACAPIKYDNWIKRYTQENKIDSSLLKALIKKESNFEPLAISISGSTGLLQFSYSTGSYYFGKDDVRLCCKVDKDETIYNSCKNEAKDRNYKWDPNDTYYCAPENDKRFDSELSIKYGAQHLGELYTKYSNKIQNPEEAKKFALAAYNQGEPCIDDAISRRYDPKVVNKVYLWDEVSEYIPTVKPCHSEAKKSAQFYVSKTLTYNQEFSKCLS